MARVILDENGLTRNGKRVGRPKADISIEQEADANFIARAREDVPFLLDMIVMLTQELHEAQAENDTLRYGDELTALAPQSAVPAPHPLDSDDR